MERPNKATNPDQTLSGASFLFEQAAVGIAQIDTNTGRFLRINKKYCDIIGYSAQEILSLDFMHITHPDDLARDLANMELLKSGQLREFSMEKRIFRRDGSVIWINLTVSPTWPAFEPPTYHIAVIENISARKLTDIALQTISYDLGRLTGEPFFRESCRCLTHLLDVEMAFVGQLVYKREPYVCSLRLWSEEAMLPSQEYSVAHTPCEYVVGKSEVIFSDKIQERFPEDQALVELGAVGYAAVPIFDTKGAPLGHVGIMSRKPLKSDRHILSVLKLFSVRIAAEIERQQRETQFHDLFEFAPDGVLIVDQQGIIQLANLQAAALFGYQRDELIGSPVDHLLPESTRAIHAAHRQSFKESGPRPMGSRRAPLYAMKRDGATFAVDVSLSPMRADRGPLIVASIRDVTERVQSEELRQRLEAQLHQSQKMEAIGTLAGGIAHDFNNLLAMISANTSFAREELSSPAAVAQSLDEIEVVTRRATELVGQILAFSRKQTPDKKLISLRALLTETSLLLRAVIPAGIELQVQLHAAPCALANAAQLQQVLVNLCTNACHALEGRTGRVVVELEELSLTALEAPPPLAPGRYARITVRDDGRGIEADNLARIFEPFFTTKETGKGSGLGLSVVHGIVQTHGGAVTVESQPGRGSTFAIYLPASPERATPETAPAATAPSEGRGHILFLDDEPGLVAAARRALTRRGYTMEGFVHPDEALEAIRREPTRFDLVVSDFNMPGRSGLAVLQDISARWPTIPVVLVSGHLEEKQKAQLLDAGARAILEKPYTIAKLIETIKESIPPGAT